MFEAYPKLKRFSGANMTITEKIDGTNGQILIGIDHGDGPGSPLIPPRPFLQMVGSRKREITPEKDNYGFARICYAYEKSLCEALGEGRHYGEWAGLGIQKNPLGLTEKLFFLFNTQAWSGDEARDERFAKAQKLVPWLRLVPILYQGKFDLDMIEHFLARTQKMAGGIIADQGTNVPEAIDAFAEGIVISCFGTKFKMTKDNRPKSSRKSDKITPKTKMTEENQTDK